MKAASDFIQTLLVSGGWYALIGCVLMLLAITLFTNSVSWVWYCCLMAYKYGISKLLPNKSQLISISVVGLCAYPFSTYISAGLQYAEHQWISPTYVGEYASFDDAHLTAIYEAELRKHTDEYEFSVIQRRTRQIADSIGSTPLCIYECAWLECALNPFIVRRDEVAAGWIQFTAAGLTGLQHQGHPVTMQQTIAACRRRDVNFIMDMTGAYLSDRTRRAGSKPMHNTIDLYLCIFAPAHIGAPHHRVLYSGFNNPAYYLNAGLDGWYINEAGIIHRSTTHCDGAITIQEIFLALECKKNALIKAHRKNTT